jgi:GNAT superfamily N-acetyltransferase
MVNITPELSLLPIQIKDHSKLFQLMKGVYKTAYQHFWTDQGDWYLELCYNPENFKKELSRKRSHYFFVEFQGKTVGILKYDFPFSPREVAIPNAMKLHRLYLDSSVHGKGVSKELMIYIEDIAKQNELDYIWLEAMLEKPQAKRFYEKMGYEWVLTYQLDFERLLTEVRGIQIMKKEIGKYL